MGKSILVEGNVKYVLDAVLRLIDENVNTNRIAMINNSLNVIAILL
jgi:hypothetical protein